MWNLQTPDWLSYGRVLIFFSPIGGWSLRRDVTQSGRFFRSRLRATAQDESSLHSYEGYRRPASGVSAAGAGAGDGTGVDTEVLSRALGGD